MTALCAMPAQPTPPTMLTATAQCRNLSSRRDLISSTKEKEPL
jgi:hypothetical protein